MASNPNPTNHFAAISKAVAPAFNRAAPDHIRWAAEAAHFERQIRECKTKINYVYQHVLLEGIHDGVEATIESCKSAIRQIASMGLTMNPSAKQVYFIPRRLRERRDGETATEYAAVPWVVDPLPSYMGLCYIGTHYAGARVFGASEVYGADAFVPKGPFELPHHRPTTDNDKRGERNAIGVYAAALFPDGITRCEYIDAPTVQLIRSLSKIPDSMMYTTLWTEGWKKVALRRLCKLAIQTDRWFAAEEAMSRAEGFTFNNETGEVEAGPDVPRGTSASEAPAKPKPARGTEGLKERMKSAQERVAEAQGNGHGHPPPEPSTPSLLALPAPSAHPEGSIEWWLDQLTGAPTLERVDEVKVAALEARLDQSADAPAFRTALNQRARQLKKGIQS